jgi:hypothetical protein
MNFNFHFFTTINTLFCSNFKVKYLLSRFMHLKYSKTTNNRNSCFSPAYNFGGIFLKELCLTYTVICWVRKRFF